MSRMSPRRGDRFEAMGCLVTVRRVSVQRWADIHVRQISTGAEWTKRQPLPFPADWVAVATEAMSNQRPAPIKAAADPHMGDQWCCGTCEAIARAASGPVFDEPEEQQ